MYEGLEEAGLRNVNNKDLRIGRINGKECVFSHWQATVGKGMHIEELVQYMEMIEEDRHNEMLQFFFLQKDKIFIVTITDSQADFDKNRLIFDSIIRSFQ